MEEKERYKYFNGSGKIDKCIFIDGQSDDYIDNLGEACDLLNQQDKRIKELESKLRVSNSLNASLSFDYNELKKQYDSQEKLLTRKLAENSILTLENQQLKEENGYIIFVDGYDGSGNEIHRQEFVKYKDKFKELVEENKQLKEHIKDLELLLNADKKIETNSLNGFEKLRQENQQLQQSLDCTNRQLDYFTNKFRSREFKRTGDLTKDIELYMKQLAISELEKVKNWCENHKDSDEYDYVIVYEEDEKDASGCEDYFKDYIDDQIKSLKGEE